jgi:hypothetical protein
MTDERTDSGLFSLAENHLFYFVSRASEDLRNQGGDGSYILWLAPFKRFRRIVIQQTQQHNQKHELGISERLQRTRVEEDVPKRVEQAVQAEGSEKKIQRVRFEAVGSEFLGSEAIKDKALEAKPHGEIKEKTKGVFSTPLCK